MTADRTLFFTQNKQALVEDTDADAHKQAYVPGQEIAKEHEALVKNAPKAPNKMVLKAPDKGE